MYVREMARIILVILSIMCVGCGRSGSKVAKSVGRAISKKVEDFPQANPRSAVAWQRRINEWSKAKPCRRCGGYKQLTCTNCKGTGRAFMTDMWGNMSVQPCPMCIGQGRPSFLMCPNCNGTGME